MMKNKLTEKILSFARMIFFDVLSVKFSTSAFKNFMDYAYVVFEKFAYSFEILTEFYIKFYSETVEKEIIMANISTKDKILVIGCGSIPATTILIGKKFKLISIDKDPIAIKKAKKLIKKLNLEENIRIINADGFKFSLSDFDVIFMLYGIKRQKELLRQLSETIKESTRIIFRTTQDVLDEFVGGKKYLEEIFAIKDSFASDSIYTSFSYLLLKKR